MSVTSGEKHTVLVIDALPVYRNGRTEYLEQQGFTVLPASDINEATKIMKHIPVDAIVVSDGSYWNSEVYNGGVNSEKIFEVERLKTDLEKLKSANGEKMPSVVVASDCGGESREIVKESAIKLPVTVIDVTSCRGDDLSSALKCMISYGKNRPCLSVDEVAGATSFKTIGVAGIA